MKTSGLLRAETRLDAGPKSQRPGLLLTASILAAVLVVGAAARATPAAAPPKDAAAGIPDEWVRDLSPEELEKFIRKAQELRLADERQKVMDEIEAGALFGDEAKRPASDILRDKPAATQKDNVDKILAAFARADSRFGRAMTLFRDGKFKACEEALRANLREEETDYFSAARHYLRAEALAGLSRSLAEANRPKEAREALFDAAEAYLLLPELMPERMSFASLSLQKAGRLFEQANRYIRAMKAYAFALRNYGLTLTADEDEALSKKVAAWIKIYTDPLRYLAGQMDDVEKRLAASDSGKATREKEEHIVLVLEDLIKTFEEKPQPPPDPNAQPPVGPPPELPDDANLPPRRKPPPTTPAANPKNPVNPLTTSVLPTGGDAERPRLENLAAVGPEGRDWIDMPPTRRDRLIEIMKHTMSERHQDLVKAYRAALSKTQAEP